jgi:hypothetical protein
MMTLKKQLLFTQEIAMMPSLNSNDFSQEIATMLLPKKQRFFHKKLQ